MGTGKRLLKQLPHQYQTVVTPVVTSVQIAANVPKPEMQKSLRFQRQKELESQGF
jgi:hypothetical protein